MVDHDHDDPTALMAEIHDDPRGFELADNGEAIMVHLDGHEESGCRWALTATSGWESAGDLPGRGEREANGNS